jgi:hypothetical protein
VHCLLGLHCEGVLKGSSRLKAHNGGHDTQFLGSQGMSYVHNRQFPGLDYYDTAPCGTSLDVMLFIQSISCPSIKRLCSP